MTQPPTPEQCAVIELRQYTLKPGRRDDLIELFDREFIESQEVVGAYLFGQFSDRDRDDRFVWVRGFRDMDERLAALQAFYGGPVWRQHSSAANDTMIAVDDVLLLQPIDPVVMPEPGTRGDDALLTATIAHVEPTMTADQRRAICEQLATANGDGRWSARLETLHAENTFPALPIREDADVVVVLIAGRAEAPREPHAPVVSVEQLRLSPTARSRLP